MTSVGQIGDVTGVQALAHRQNLKIVEDAAHCCPAYSKKTTDHGTMGPRAGKVEVSSPVVL